MQLTRGSFWNSFGQDEYFNTDKSHSLAVVLFLFINISIFDVHGNRKVRISSHFIQFFSVYMMVYCWHPLTFEQVIKRPVFCSVGHMVGGIAWQYSIKMTLIWLLLQCIIIGTSVSNTVMGTCLTNDCQYFMCHQQMANISFTEFSRLLQNALFVLVCSTHDTKIECKCNSSEVAASCSPWSVTAGADVGKFQEIFSGVEVLLQTNCEFLAYYAWTRTYPSRSCKRNPWCQHVHHATRRRSQEIDMVWRHVALATTTISAYRLHGVTSRCFYEKTYPLQTCYEHNMLSLLHAVCLKVLVFFTNLCTHIYY